MTKVNCSHPECRVVLVNAHPPVGDDWKCSLHVGAESRYVPEPPLPTTPAGVLREMVDEWNPNELWTAEERRAVVDAALEEARGEGRREAFVKAKAALGFYEPWPVTSVLRKLVEVSNILLQERQFDGHGHELMSHATVRAEVIAERVEAYVRALADTPPPDTGWRKPEDVTPAIMAAHEGFPNRGLWVGRWGTGVVTVVDPLDLCDPENGLVAVRPVTNELERTSWPTPAAARRTGSAP